MPQGSELDLGNRRALDVLIIENDPAAARLTKEAFKAAGLNDGVVSIPDGDHALAALRREDGFKDHPHPDLICLDLHLPRKSGLVVLKELKKDSQLKLIPVIVISGSDDPEEVRQAYELHASCYIRKPDDLDSLLQFIQVCYQFWGSVVTLPPEPELAHLGRFR